MTTNAKDFFARWLRPPVFADEEQTRHARVLHFLILALLVLLALAALLGLAWIFSARWLSATAILALLAVLVVSAGLLRAGHVRQAGLFLISAFWLVLAALMVFAGGIYSSNGVYLVAMTMIAALLLGARATLAMAVLNSLLVLGLALAEISGHPPPQFFPTPPLARWLNLTLALIATLIPLLIALKGFASALAQARTALCERQRVEAALRDSEQRLATIFDSVNDAIFVHDTETGAIVDVNQRMLEMYGVTRAEALASTPESLGLGEAPYDLAQALEWMRKAVEEGPQIFEWQARRKDGDLFWVEVNMRVALIGGLRRILVVARDISERKRTAGDIEKYQMQVLQSQKMESIGRLAGGVAHDFNNLLTGILGYLSLAKMDAAMEDPIQEKLDAATKAAVSAASLTQQLLMFSRKQIIKPQPLDLNEVVADMHKLLLRMIREDIVLTLTPARLPAMILADVGQLQQIIMNLAVNARDAMPHGGELFIETKRVNLHEAFCQTHPDLKPGPYIRLSVRDTGCGMSQEVLDCLFEPFFTTKPKGQGTGLGLATVFGAVKQNHGLITVQSEVGQGSRFQVYFPAVTAPVKASETSARQLQVPSGNESVVLVEDEAGVRDLAVQMLERLGYRVQAFGDPLVAFQALLAVPKKVDLLIADVVMPGMNGRVLAEKLKARMPTLKVLFCSGYTEDLIVHQGIVEKNVNFLPKPFTHEELARKVRDALSRPA